MPLHVEPARSATPAHYGRDRRAASHGIVIGVLNNMPDAALEATEGQFAALRAAAAGCHSGRRRFSGRPGGPRRTATPPRTEATHSSLRELVPAVPAARPVRRLQT